MSRKQALQAKFAELKPEGREVRKILREADSKGRPLTADEQSRVDGFLAKVKPIADALDQ
ncbi:MAG: Phage major capsid protein, partial [Actinomycetota bacterium]|nr:Phage major capsid protein [Actinomycetota bacterium]